MNYDLSGVASSRESTLLNSNGRTIQSPSLEAKTASTGMLYTAYSSRGSPFHNDSPLGIDKFLSLVASDDVQAVKSRLESNYTVARGLIQARNSRGSTALHIACREGFLSMVTTLASCGAEIEARDRIGRTPLLISSEYGHLEIVKLLQSRFGANVDARDTLERTAFHLSCCCRDPDVSRFIIQLRPELREAVDRHGRTGLFYAVLNSDRMVAEKVSEMILRSRQSDGLTAHCVDSYQRSPLDYASQESREGLVVLLQHYGAVNSQRKAPESRVGDSIPRVPKICRDVNGNDSRAGLQRAECGAPGQLTFGDSKFHDYRARLMTLLQTIQQNGLEHMYHVKRPDLFSGSWMEGISGTDDLFAEEGELLRTSCNVSEALIRVCNLLSPPASMPAPNSAVTSEDLLERYLVVNSDDVSGGKGRGSANSDKCEKGNRERESMQIVEKERDDKLLELMRQIKAADEKLGTAVSVAEYTALQEEAAELRGLKTQLEIQLMDLRGQASFAAEKARTMTDELEKRCRENGELAVQLAAAQAMIDNMAVDAARKQTVQEGYDRLERQLVVMKGEKGNLLRQNEVLEAEVKRMVTIAGDEKRAEVDRVEQENGKLRQRLGELEEKLERLDKDKSEEMTTEEPSESERKKGEAEREMKTKDRAEKWLSYLDDRDPSIADNAITSRIAVEVSSGGDEVLERYPP